MKEILQKGIKVIGILLAGAVVGAALLTLTFSLPVEQTYNHYLNNGLESIGRRDGWHRYLYDYSASTLDNCTEQLMLKVVSTPLPDTGENIFQKAMRCYTLNGEWNHGLTFQQYEWKGQILSCDSYERYWHGYAVILKPLLMLFDYTDIVFINIGLHIFLMFFLLLTLEEKNYGYLRSAFIILWVISMQIVIMLCLDYSVCFYIYMLAAIVLLRCPKCRKYYFYFFLLIGMLTSYFDLLTWPLITLAVPLAILLCMEQIESIREKIKKAILAALFWGIGYLGQWASKWIIASLVLSDNVIVDAVRQFLLRSSSVSEERDSFVQATLWTTIERNYSVFLKKGYLVIFAIIIMYLIYYLRSQKRKIIFGEMIPYILLAFYPFMWYIITRNHSYVHYWMTWRNFTISLFSIICGILYSSQQFVRNCIDKKT